MARQKAARKRRTRTQSERHSAAWWAEQLERWAASGVSKAAYCAANGLSPASFYQWSSRLRHRKTASNEPERPATKQPSPFVEVVLEPEAPPAASACQVSLGEVSLSFPGGLQPEDLPHWIRALRTASC